MTMTMTIGRRGLLGSLATAGMLQATLPWDLALAQGTPGTNLRIGMTASAVPLPNGMPDQGAEGHRFMGITLYDHLVAWDLSVSDRPAPLRPGLATEWHTDPADPKRWIFTIREGVKFHDGKILDAEDIAFSYDRCFKNDAPHYDARGSAQVRSRMPTISRWYAEGPRIFVIETSVVDSMVPYGATWVGITHRGAWEAAGRDNDRMLNQPVGTGPFKLESFSFRERAVLVRNPDHWEARRIPKLGRVTLIPLPEANTRVAALRSSQVDFIEAPPPDSIPSLRQAGFQIVTNQYGHNWTWHFSLRDGSPWRDIRVRRAANLAIDREAMKGMLAGTMLEGGGLVPVGGPWNPVRSPRLAYDAAAARKLLTAAGITPRTPLRTKVAISASGSGQMQVLAMNEALQQQLKDVGIEITFEVFEWNTLLSTWREGAGVPAVRGCDAINVSYTALDPYTAMIRLLKSDLVPPRANNWGYLNDPGYDAIIERIYQTFETAAQDALIKQLHDKVLDDALFLFVAHDMNPRAMSRQVKGFVQAQSWFQDLTPISL
ncbi:ABC transporter substrate-binding protein [Siccirubricoccus deserti]|uniref:ABC transporter substrate-binding protein n=1 Tax=Siccirubricoccus deserti TaxID=2013562 RepID=A0A9X0QZB5_9PROT|nr:ABC transporter substrate-binding protein [Siccirubricoccus deserti]MBC4015437.1 ABC transporter substrate-binding protein [Siccirubricoccus deserti]GGC41671.1 ABC transporter substrate-binding protein [Siccirubricoccus deserti]